MTFKIYENNKTPHFFGQGSFYPDNVVLASNFIGNDGTAMEPTFSFKDEDDLGLWRAGNGLLGFSSGGTNRLIAGPNGVHIQPNGGIIPVDVSSAFEITSTTQGMLPPRMTTIQRDAIVLPTTGLLIYNTTSQVIETYNGAVWGSPAAADNLFTNDIALAQNTLHTGGNNSFEINNLSALDFGITGGTI